MLLPAYLMLLGLAVATDSHADWMAWGQLIVLSLGSLRFLADARETIWSIALSWLFLAFACLLPVSGSTVDLGPATWARLSLWIGIWIAGLSGIIRLSSSKHLGWLVGVLITLAPPVLWYLAGDFSDLRPGPNPFLPPTDSHFLQKIDSQTILLTILTIACPAGWMCEQRRKHATSTRPQQA
jgi:hypothetical protein